MNFKSYLSKTNNWIVYIFLTSLVVFILVSSNVFINYLKREESDRMKLFADAQKYLHDEEINDPKVLELALKIIEENNNIPVIVTDYKKQIKLYRNIPENIEKDPKKLRALFLKMERGYPPIEVKMPNNKNDFIYYSNSRVLEYIFYYPIILVIFFLLYVVFSLWFLKTIRKNSENYLWAGIAKETAHQIGTPLSSIMGWMEILKNKYGNNEEFSEIEKDIERLTSITDRFSKIGSKTELEDLDLKDTLTKSYNYLVRRTSDRIKITLNLPRYDIQIPHSKVLIGWVIENLVKNAIDSMKGEGNIEILLIEKNRNSIEIFVKDNGSGMTKAQIRKAFKHGFSTKKRGWGIGLSLSQRAINDYHRGDIKILSSEVGKGTTFKITLRGQKK